MQRLCCCSIHPSVCLSWFSLAKHQHSNLFVFHLFILAEWFHSMCCMLRQFAIDSTKDWEKNVEFSKRFEKVHSSAIVKQNEQIPCCSRALPCLYKVDKIQFDLFVVRCRKASTIPFIWIVYYSVIHFVPCIRHIVLSWYLVHVFW